MNKKLFCAVLALFAVVFLAYGLRDDVESGTFSYDAPGERAELLSFFGFKYEPENVIMFESLLDEFTRDNPDINVLYEGIKGRDYYRILRRRLETGNGDDMFMIDHDTLLDFTREGRLVDLSGLPETSAFNALALDQVREDSGAIFALPLIFSAFGLYCNLELLERYDVPVPVTLPEFLDACRTFAGAGLTPVVANNDISLKTLVMARGMYDFYREPELNARYAAVNAGTLPLSRYYRSGFELLKLMCERGYIDVERTLVTNKTQDDLTDFATGEYPFMLTGAWASARLKDEVGFRYAVVPYPVREDGAVLVVNVDCRLALNAAGHHTPEALRLIRYMVSRFAVQRFTDSQSSLSPLKEKQVPFDAAVRGLPASLESGRFILGADSRFRFPVWEISRRASLMILKGASVHKALLYLDQTVSDAVALRN